MIVQLVGILCVLLACGAFTKLSGTAALVLGLIGVVGFFVCLAIANHDAVI